MALPIQLTTPAKNRIIELTQAKPGTVGLSLRIAQGKGCGGNEYKIERVEQEPAGHDKIEVADGVALYIPVTDSFMMFGMVIDFGEDDIGNKQFHFTNPNEGERCGCGESFSIDPSKLPRP